MGKAADITTFQVNAHDTPNGHQEHSFSTGETSPAPSARAKTRRLRTKGFQVTPEAARQFEILKAESGQSGPVLIAEALNLLFQQYRKSHIS